MITMSRIGIEKEINNLQNQLVELQIECEHPDEYAVCLKTNGYHNGYSGMVEETKFMQCGCCGYEWLYNGN